MMKPLKVLELYAGIGGMHAALLNTGVPHEVIGTWEINPTALSIYTWNYSQGHKIKPRNVMNLQGKDLEASDLVLMSPPCQPYTRLGHRKGSDDSRCQSLLHFMDILEGCGSVPQCILVENVAGFELSDTHARLLSVLRNKGYTFQELLISPPTVGIPNSRLRYYLLAKHNKEFVFFSSEQVQTAYPVCLCIKPMAHSCSSVCTTCHLIHLPSVTKLLCSFHASRLSEGGSGVFSGLCPPLLEFLEEDASDAHLIQETVLHKYAWLFDIIDADSCRSCCFTRGYSRLVEGSGSVLKTGRNTSVDTVFCKLKSLSKEDPTYMELLKSLHLRYFTPREILNLMGFPKTFSLPPHCSLGQTYRALGNSVNVLVVTCLLLTLMADR